MKSLFMWIALGAILCAFVVAESEEEAQKKPARSIFGQVPKRPKLIRPLPARPQIAKAPAVVANSTSAPESTRTTYNWGQHTGSTFDWGKYTSTQSPNQGQQNTTGAPSEGTTYDWGQHTGSTFDWGKYTSTKAPNNGQQNSTSASTGTTYNWGQHTGSTYDWGQHTKPTQGPNQNGTDNGDNNNNNNQTQHKCGAGSYSCAGAPGLCISLKQICNGIIDCPMADDEEPRVCHPNYVPAPSAANSNRFRGQGFMFHIRNIKVGGGSHVKLFNQQSDNHVQKSG